MKAKIDYKTTMGDLGKLGIALEQFGLECESAGICKDVEALSIDIAACLGTAGLIGLAKIGTDAIALEQAIVADPALATDGKVVIDAIKAVRTDLGI